MKASRDGMPAVSSSIRKYRIKGDLSCPQQKSPSLRPIRRRIQRHHCGRRPHRQSHGRPEAERQSVGGRGAPSVPPAGFKYLVTEMVWWAAGGPQKYTGRSMADSPSKVKFTKAAGRFIHSRSNFAKLSTRDYTLQPKEESLWQLHKCQT
jgi:hypothetical protein